jgi:sigma-B regulation protein RsbU (phosphoserine phosphatase)
MKLGNVSIRNESDVIFLRNKMYEIVDLLSQNKMLATRLSSSISSILKQILISSQINLNIELKLSDTIKSSLVLHLSVIEGLNLLEIIDEVYLNYCKVGIVSKSNALTIEYKSWFNEDTVEKAIEVFKQKSRDELINDIQTKNAELKSSFENLKKAKDLNARMENELEVGKNIQMSMLPAKSFINDQVEISANLIPAREVGGDFYDFVIMDNGFLYFTVGDVSGKGVPAALMMAVCKALLKSKATTDKSTANILTEVNEEIARDNEKSMFITVFIAILNLKTGELIFSNAGHNPTYIIRNKKTVEKLSNLHGPVIGAVEGIDYKEDKLNINHGDMIFAYTDGIPEAHNSEGKMFTDARLKNFLSENANLSCDDTIDLICTEVLEFEGGADRFDDITALAITSNIR